MTDDLINPTEALQIYSGLNLWSCMLDKSVGNMLPKKWRWDKNWKVRKIKVNKNLKKKIKT